MKNNNLETKISKQIREEYSKVGFFRRVFAWKDIINNINVSIDNREDDWKREYDILLGDFNEINLEKVSSDETKKALEEIKNKNIELDNELKQKVAELTTIKNQLESSNKEMLEKTSDLHKIFNRSTGKQGKISEFVIENILNDYFGNDSTLWTENLHVGNSRVEFAIRASDEEENSWIPVDSKSVIPEIVDGEYIIDSKFATRVLKQAKEIEKYISKSNTADYAILVLPTEEVSTILFDENMDVFKQAADLGVYITSPRTFIQFINQISILNNDISKIKESKQILTVAKLARKHAENFYNASKDGIDKINTAFGKHMVHMNKNIDKLEKLESGENVNIIDVEAEDNNLIE